MKAQEEEKSLEVLPSLFMVSEINTIMSSVCWAGCLVPHALCSVCLLACLLAAVANVLNDQKCWHKLRNGDDDGKIDFQIEKIGFCEARNRFTSTHPPSSFLLLFILIQFP